MGTDWNFSGQPWQQDVYISQGAGELLYGSQTAIGFLAVNQTRKALSFQPLVGCQPAGSAAARVAGVRRAMRRVVTRTLRPGRSATFTHRCRPGERLVGSGSGVGFFQERPPSARELREVSIRHSERRGRVRVRVTTGPHVGDDERVRLQIHAVCRG